MGCGAKLLLMGLSMYVFSMDIANLFAPSPPKLNLITDYIDQDHDLRHPHQPIYQPFLKFPPHQKSSGAIGMESNVVNINFCTSFSYRVVAVKTKKMLETAFPGIKVVLGNQPPEFGKVVVIKAVLVVQAAIIGIALGGEQIFPRMGISSPPPLYYTLRANRLRSFATTWFLGNFLQTFLLTTGAFELYCNGELVFSKLNVQRFPGEFELKDLVGKKLTISRTIL